MSVSKTVPAREAIELTPNDAVTFDRAFTALWVGSAGTVTLTDTLGNNAAFVIPAPGLLPVQATRVLSTGTTATDIVGLRS